MRRFAIPLIALALAVIAAGHGRDLSAESTVSGARLTAISSTVDGTRAALLIEASEPVAYATSQPDPQSVIVDLRNVSAAGYANGFVPRATSPIRSVSVEEARAPDGATVARVHVRLAVAATPRVRSQRNVIFVEVEGGDASGTALARSSTEAPVKAARVLRAVKPVVDAGGVSIVLEGDGTLGAPRVLSPQAPPHRLVLDFPNVTPDVGATIPVSHGAVDRVRVALNSRSPLRTRVVVDLTRPATHTIEPAGERGEALRVRFADGARASAGAARPAGLPVVVLDPILALAGTAGAGSAGPLGESAAEAAPARPAEPAPAPAATPRAADQATTTRPSEPRAFGPPPQAAAATTQATAPAPQTAAPAPQTAPARLGQEATISRTGEKVYTGHPVSLDFQGADLRAVLRTFAEISGLNIVIDPAVQGSVDVALRDVPWDQALDIILRANKLGYFLDGTIVRVAPLTVLAEEEKQRRRLAEEQALAGELRVVTRTLSYAKADEVAPLLVKSALSQRGSVQVDPRTNTLIISDLQASLDTATALISTLDMPQPQVEIEARIVQTTRDFARTIGVQWGLNGRAAPDLANTLPLAFPNSGSISGRTGGFQGPVNNPTPTSVNLGVPAATSAIGLALGAINGSFNLDVVLSALERSGHGRLLSTPRVSTQNNVEAEITQGVQIPIQTVANNTVTVTFKDAALTLKVTPQITSANTVIMKIAVENASPDFSRAVGDSQIPPIDTQRANTQVLVSDGQTTVIGGIYVSREQSVEDRTPGLHRIPLLGWLFKRQGVQDESRELLIFITPRILRS